MKHLLVRNLGDAKYTLLIGEQLLNALPPRRQRVALIEAHCLGMVGRANCFGIDVNVHYTHQLATKLESDAASLLAQLEPHGVTEAVVRSPNSWVPCCSTSGVCPSWVTPTAASPAPTRWRSTNSHRLTDVRSS